MSRYTYLQSSCRIRAAHTPMVRLCRVLLCLFVPALNCFLVNHSHTISPDSSSQETKTHSICRSVRSSLLDLFFGFTLVFIRMGQDDAINGTSGFGGRFQQGKGPCRTNSSLPPHDAGCSCCSTKWTGTWSIGCKYTSIPVVGKRPGRTIGVKRFTLVQTTCE